MERIIIFLAFVTSFRLIKGQCKGKVDLVIAVPGSARVPPSEFATFENNLIELLRHFTIEPEQFNVGLVLYGKNAVPIAYPQPFKTRTQINTRVTLLSQRNAYLHTLGLENDVSAALNAIVEMFSMPPPDYHGKISRVDARKVGVVFTYGRTDPAKVQSVIDAAVHTKTNYMMYALSANGTSEDFPRIGSDYCRLFSMGTLSQSLHHAVPDLASGICSEVDPNIHVSQGNCFPMRYGKARDYGVTCQVEGNMIQPDPNNCAYYYQCEYFDVVPIKKDCPTSTLYDPLTRTCNWKQNVLCYSELMCPDNSKPMLYAHPMDCSKFVNCDQNRIPYVLSCPPGTVFDEKHQTCNETMGVCLTN